MAGSLYAPASKDSMVAGFPSTIAGIIGTPTQREMLRAFRHMISCSQSHFTDYNHLNWLFLVVPVNMWPYYAGDPLNVCPPLIEHPGDSPSYDAMENETQNKTTADLWAKDMKDHVESNHMNKALCERFLSLFSTAQRKSYSNTLIKDPNRSFGETFEIFYKKFGKRDEVEIENNKDGMKAHWNVADGWDDLKDRFDDGIAFAAFADAAIENGDVLNMLLSVIVKTKQFEREYEEWHNLPNDSKTLINAFEWWEAKTRTKIKFGATAGSMGRAAEYGGGANEGHEPGTNMQYDDLVAEFARGHAATQETITTQQAQLQQQAAAMLAMQNQFAMAMSGQPQGNQGRGGQGGRRGQGRGRGGGRGGNQPGWSAASTTTSTNNGSSKFYRTDFPDHIRSNETAKYCWSHGHDMRHNGSECTSRCAGHQPNARTHVGTKGNPKNSERTTAPSTIGLVGVDRMAATTTAATTQPRQPTWSQQANAVQQNTVQQPVMQQGFPMNMGPTPMPYMMPQFAGSMMQQMGQQQGGQQQGFQQQGGNGQQRHGNYGGNMYCWNP
jgi:hypothetical protein